VSDTIIQVENLSKKYTIGHQQEGRYRYKTLRDILAASAKSLRRQFLNSKKQQNFNSNLEEFWALKDVEFEIRQGDRVGIIGRNGAGKSTLLKILSRITEPTFGSIKIKGRVASLLEVGTGFHPELTGRENIYLNGAILGMTKEEIKRKFDEIVDFAEITKFLDTPVKRYSSGMYVRLAFAVAAHLEPEVLIVDEVLAVGDAQFQQKCLGKMEDVARGGRTVLFVSHNMVALQSLCDRAIWLDRGKVMQEGSSGQVVSHYLKTSFSTLTEQVWHDRETAPGNHQVRLHRVGVRPIGGVPTDAITVRSSFLLEFEYWNQQSDANLALSFQLYNEQGILIFAFGRIQEPEWESNIPLGLLRDTCKIPGDLLNSGMHRVELFIGKNQDLVYHHHDVLVFDVRDSAEIRGDWYGEWPGAVRPMLDWTIERVRETPLQPNGQLTRKISDGKGGEA
jgi:lipopolysaccharide transport system ATP-binding protein